jgi:murein L,D-transpeptidase YcbB/YkuD
MEVNPQWVIPMSIIETDVAKRAGDTTYFARNRYHIFDRKTNKELPVPTVSKEMLLSGKYKVAQEGGAGNSLGRIIFRFKNSFQVFLHDTSNPGAFERSQRSMSHGCVRVAKPFNLCQYVLGDDADEWLLDRIRISMGLNPVTEQGISYLQEHAEDNLKEGHHKLAGYVPVKHATPLYIIYYTLWTDENGTMRSWPDVYGYDKVMWSNLISYMQ